MPLSDPLLQEQVIPQEEAGYWKVGGWGLEVWRYRLPQLGQRRRHPALKRRDFRRIDFRRRDPPKPTPMRSRLCCHNATLARSRAPTARSRVWHLGNSVSGMSRTGSGSGSEPVGSDRFVGLVDPSPAYRTTLTAPPTLYPNPSTA